MTNNPQVFSPGVAQIAKVPVTLRKQREMMGYRYYDSVQVPLFAAPINNYQFFKDIQGKNTFQTNMSVGGYLPADELFEVKGIAMTFSPPDLDWITMQGAATWPTWAVAANLMRLGFWELHIGDKVYNKGPLHEIVTTKSEYFYTSTIGAIVGFEHQDTPFFKQSGMYPLEVPVTLEKGIPFYVNVQWNNNIMNATGVTTPRMWIYCHLFGRRERRAIG
jgi:hypothetical protein